MDPLTVSAVLGLSALSGLTTLVGVVLAQYAGRRLNGVAFGVGFAAGIMVWVAGFGLLPQSAAQAGVVATGVAVTLGVAGIALVETVVFRRLRTQGPVPAAFRMKTAYMITLGLIIHDFPEGIAMADAFIAQPSLGLLVALAIVLHNVPEEFALAAPLVALREKRTLYGAAALSALAEPAGAVTGLAIGALAPAIIPFLMATSAGAMLFVATRELLPLARRCGRPGWSASGLVASAAVYVALAAVIK